MNSTLLCAKLFCVLVVSSSPPVLAKQDEPLNKTQSGSIRNVVVNSAQFTPPANTQETNTVPKADAQDKKAEHHEETQNTKRQQQA